jgi:hypothetical protein
MLAPSIQGRQLRWLLARNNGNANAIDFKALIFGLHGYIMVAVNWHALLRFLSRLQVQHGLVLETEEKCAKSRTCLKIILRLA